MPVIDGLDVSQKAYDRAKHYATRSKLAGALPPELLFALCEFLHAYQLRFLFDDAQSITVTASRQVGKSLVLALRAVLQALSEQERHQYLISRSQAQADSLMAKVKKWVRWIEKIINRPVINRDGENNKSCATFVNGSEIRSLPCSPDSARGYTGDVIIDEAAFLPSAGDMRDAAFGIASLDHYRKILASTPMGDRGLFHDYARGPLGKDWSHHTITVHEAVKDGQMLNIEKLRAERTVDAFAQEYECAFLSDAASYFPRDMLEAATLTYEAIQQAVKAEREKLARVYGGVDIGRKNDLTALAWCGKTDKGRFASGRVEALSKTPFDEQEEWLALQFRTHKPRPARIWMDEGGLGMHMTENLSRRFPGMVEGVNFSATDFKRQLVETARMLFEQGKLGIDPEDRDTLLELNSIRRKLTPSGRLTYEVDGQGAIEGHADRATARLLAICAAFEERVGFFETTDTAEAQRATMENHDPNATRQEQVKETLRAFWAQAGIDPAELDGHSAPEGDGGLWTEV